MARITGDTVGLNDLEELIAGNDGEIRQMYDPAENGWVYYNEDLDEKLMVVRTNGQVVIPIEADIEAAAIASLLSDLDFDGNDLLGADLVEGNEGQLSDLRELTSIDGSILSDSGPLSRIDGAGLSIEDGDMVVTAEFEDIEGMSNPATDDLDMDGYDIEQIGHGQAESLHTDALEITDATSGATKQTSRLLVDDAPVGTVVLYQYSPDHSDGAVIDTTDTGFEFDRPLAGLITVAGDDAGKRFEDVLSFTGTSTTPVVVNSGEDGDPQPRSYSRDGEDLELEYGGDGDDANVCAFGQFGNYELQ